MSILSAICSNRLATARNAPPPHLGLFALDVNAEPSAPAAGDYGRAPNVPQGRRGARSRRHGPALEQKLTQAEERVALGHDRIAYQREVVSGKEDDRLDGAIACAMLTTYRQSCKH